MKTFIQAVAVAAVLAVPAVSFAQSNAPLTRAQVRAELVQLEQAGYQPNTDNYDYPVQLQAVERRVAAQNATASAGGVVAGTSQSGVSTGDARSLYSGS